MRHFYYPYIYYVKNNIHKARVALYSKESKKKYKITNMLSNISFFLTIILMITLFTIVTGLIKESGLDSLSKVGLSILGYIGSILLPIFIVVIPFSSLIERSRPIPLHQLNRNLVKEFTKVIMDFYKVGNDYIITKCYDSTEKKLINKDVILFLYQGKLRIINDFTISVVDFGCYEFSKDEIVISYEQKGNKSATSIQSKDIYISLGKRAKPFILNRMN